jgi:N-acetyl-anhydromuramyl-L-alanine amidase AmpD
MNITFIKSPHFNTGRNGYTPIAIVIHIMQGTLDGTDSWFQDQGAKPPESAHYGIGKNGAVHHYVLQQDTAWHAGIVTSPSWKLIKTLDASKHTYIDSNLYTFGITHEGFENTDWTDATYQASSQVVAGLAKKWNIPLNRDHVIGHHEIYSQKTCPGKKVDLDKLISMALKITSPEPLTEPGNGVAPTIPQSVLVTAPKPTTKVQKK